MLVTDVGRGLLIATIPVAYALGHSTWPQLYVVAFGTGTLSVFFYVAYGGFFQTIVRREDYVAANSLSHGSRAFSFLAGTSLGGVLVQLLRGPYALAIDARLVYLVGVLPRPRRRARPAGGAARRRRARGRALDPPQRDHPCRAARRRDAQPLQLHLLRAVPALRNAVARTSGRRARRRARRRLGGDAARLGGHGPHLASHRPRACVPVRLLPLPRAAHPRPGRGRAALARPRLPVHRRVPLRARPHAARHPGRDDHGRRHPATASLAGVRRVHGREQRRAPGRNGDRRRARLDARPAADALDRDRRGALRHVLPAAVADPDLHDVPEEAAA